jgi:putative hemolysin
MSTSTEIAFLLTLVLANGLLAGAEIAVVTVRRSRIQELIEQGHRAARLLERLRQHPERFFATVQVGITVFGVTAGAFGGARFGEDLAAVLERWSPLAPYASSIAYVVVVGLVTYLSLIFGELVPKSLALRSSERYALLVAGPLSALEAVAAPAVWILTVSSNAVLRLFGDRTDFLETKVSLEEVRRMVDDASEEGALDPEVGTIAARALELSELTAHDVMIHRRFVRAIPIDADEETLRAAFLESGHRRYPVYDGTIDNIVGYLSWRDVVLEEWKGKPASARELLRQALLVPETAPVTDTLRRMQQERQHLVVVVDEHGGLSGIVTIEDLLEELVGEIDSEHGTQNLMFEQREDGSRVVRGELPLRELDRALGTHLEQASDARTVGGLIAQLAGDRIPPTGEVFRTPDGTRLEILEASPRRVRRVVLRTAEPSASGSATQRP